jgi:3-oxoacyl-(acyl-carrier-protein) synthase
LESIRRGECDVVVTGGAEAALTPSGLAGFCSLKALSTRNDDPRKASRPFDANRDGFVMGEGAGVLIFEELEHAKARGAEIYAEVVGFGMTDDAHHITAPDPSGQAGMAAVRSVLTDAQLNPEDVTYVNCHGTSTPLNDKAETNLFKQVLGDHAYSIPFNSTKSMIGHLLGGAGGVELVASVMSIKTGMVHPTINYETPDPECDLDYVPNTAREHDVDLALSNSLGFGGHNAVVAVRKFHG